MKKIKLFVLLITLVLLTGCKEIKVPYEPDDYIQILTEMQLPIDIRTEEFEYSEMTVLSSTNNFYALYMKGKRRYDIEGLFLDECRNVYSEALEGYKKKTAGDDGWVSLEVEDDKHYYYVIYVEDTFLSIKTDAVNKAVARNLIEEMGY